MINTILLIIILIILCLLYNIQLKKDKLKKIKTEINNKYQKAYNEYIPYHINGSFNSDVAKKIELYRVLNINKNYDLIDELTGSVWYSSLLKEVDIIIK
jgi:hypothetical protein